MVFSEMEMKWLPVAGELASLRCWSRVFALDTGALRRATINTEW